MCEGSENSPSSTANKDLANSAGLAMPCLRPLLGGECRDVDRDGHICVSN